MVMINTTADQDSAAAYMITVPEVKGELAAKGYPLTTDGYHQAIHDQVLFGPVARWKNSIDQARLAKLAADPVLTAQVDALATPVAKP